MKKINTRNTSKKTLFVSLIVAGVLLTGGVVYAFYSVNMQDSTTGASEDTTTSNKTDGPSFTDPATEEQVQDGQDIKKETIDADQNPSSSDTVNMVITRAAQTNQTVQIRAFIEAIVSGTCSVAITNNSRSYSANASTKALASFTTCQGFDIPVNVLGTGKWSIELTFSGASKSGSVSTTLTVE